MQSTVAQFCTESAFTAPASCGNEFNFSHYVKLAVVHPQDQRAVQVILNQFPERRLPS